MKSRTKGIIAIVTSAFGFAVMAACVRLCDDCGASVSCFEKSFFRNVVAFAIAAVAFCRAASSADEGKGRGATRISAGAWGVLSLRCVLGTIGIVANFYALSRIPIADGQTLNKTAPFFTVIFAWLFLKERASARQFLAVFTAFLGAVLIVKPGFAGADAFALAMGLMSGLCAGAAYTAVRALGSRGVSPALIVMVFSGFSCLSAVPFTLLDYTPLTLAQLLVLLGAGLGGALGQFGITLAYRFAAPREIAAFDYTNIVFTALFGFLLFGQLSDLCSIAGILIIFSAALLLSRART